MKSLLEILIGFVGSLGMFVVGLAVATVLLTAEPERQPGPSVDVADLWTAEPRKVDSAKQDLERLPALQPRADPNLSAETRADAADTASTADVTAGPVDTMTTGSVQAAGEEQPAKTALSAAHANWCASRYRSYRKEDDSYTRYDGERWPCVSPHSRNLAAEAGGLWPTASEADSYDTEFAGDPSSAPWGEASDDPNKAVYINSDHVSYCLSRYRSYRPEDNTYQPFGGGPRRQCR